MSSKRSRRKSISSAECGSSLKIANPLYSLVLVSSGEPKELLILGNMCP